MSKDFLEVLKELQHRLLDLSSRNKLLNFRFPRATSLKFEVDDLQTIYKKIVDEQSKLRIDGVTPPETKPRPDITQFLKSNRWRPSGDLPVILYDDTLLAISRKIEREAKSSINETGTNTLFLILGFLEYQDSRDSKISYHAPLVSIPVTIDKKQYRGQTKYYLSSNGDELQENLSLREKMKRDFGIIMPEFDDETFDFKEYLSAVEKAIKRYGSFKINHDAALGFLNFKGMLIIKDLDPDNWEIKKDNLLLKHPILKKLFGVINAGETQSTNGYEVESSYHVDQPEYTRLPLVYDADHSQHSALIDVLIKNKDLVIQGPPGTGKSQTITNIIAGALDKGMSVLFVAEKLAALEVVKNRLDRVGLEPLILELHSDKANKKAVLESLGRRLEYYTTEYSSLDGDIRNLQKTINELNKYSDLMKVRLHDDLNLTIYTTLWRCIQLRDSGLGSVVFDKEFMVTDVNSMIIDLFNERIDYLVDLNEALEALGPEFTTHPFDGFHPNTPTPSLIVELKKVLTGLNSDLSRHKDALLDYESYWSDNSTPPIKSLQDFVDKIEQWINVAESFASEDLIGGIASSISNSRDTKYLFDLLSKLEDKITKINELKKSYSDVILNEDDIKEDDSQSIFDLVAAMNESGVEVLSQELVLFHNNLQGVINKSTSSFNSINEILNKYELNTDDSVAEIQLWRSIGYILAQTPVECYKYQSDKLFRNDSTILLDELVSLKKLIQELEIDLKSKLHLDKLPTDKELSHAIRTLRIGTEWYRVFSSDFRSAVRLHKSIDKSMRKIDARQRLIELERLSTLIDRKLEWNQHPAWREIIGHDPSLGTDLNSISLVAKWNNNLASVLNKTVEDIDKKWVEKVISIVKDSRIEELNLQLNILWSSLEELRTILPNYGLKLDVNGILFVVNSYESFSKSITSAWPFIEKYSKILGTVSKLQDCLTNLFEAKKLINELNESNNYAWMAGYFEGINTNLHTAKTAVSIIEELIESEISPEIQSIILNPKPIETAKKVLKTLKSVIQFGEVVDMFKLNISTLGKLNYKRWVRLPVGSKPSEHLARLIEKNDKVLASGESIYSWTNYWNLREKANDLNVLQFVVGMENGTFPGERIADVYKLAVYNSLITDYFIKYPEFSSWTGAKLNQLRKAIKERDKEIISKRGKEILNKRSDIRTRFKSIKPGIESPRVDEKTEMPLIRHLIGQTRPRVPLRKLIHRAPSAIKTLKPCFMMSPQSVVRFLPPSRIEFDLLVMDEASQLKPEEAISAIARSKQVVVVGDSKQLPPTSFFQTNIDSQLEDDDSGSVVTDVESILEIASRAFDQSRSLKVHYRSRHQSLVAYSNHNFYENKLLLFPSPYEPNVKYGVRAMYLADGYFQDGLNPVEASKVVDLIVDHVSNRSNETLGVVAVNLKQRDLISELLEQRVQQQPELGVKVEQMHEPLFIKNLENVQGDERDVIIVSTTYGPKPNTSNVQQRFGPIGFENGWRRLNVLFTRARNSMIVCTSLKPSDIKVDENSKLGVSTFKGYLEYIFNGCVIAGSSNHEPESEFEESVISLLRENGFEAIPQLGVAGFRIDIAVKHPHFEGLYLAAIECDGAKYHSTASARERDRIRQEILEDLGWRGKIWRIWSTDWFLREEEEKRKLLEFLTNRMEELQEVYEPITHWEVIGSRNEEELILKQNGADTIIDNIEVSGIDSTLLGEDIIEIGDSITYLDLEFPLNQKVTTIVRGKSDENLNHYRFDTPFAVAFLGRAVDEIAELKLKEKVKRFKILKIHKVSDE